MVFKYWLKRETPFLFPHLPLHFACTGTFDIANGILRVEQTDENNFGRDDHKNTREKIVSTSLARAVVYCGMVVKSSIKINTTGRAEGRGGDLFYHYLRKTLSISGRLHE